MSLRWDFNEDFIGRVKHYDERKGGAYYTNLYSGNALMIELYETKKHYWLTNFAADLEHLKNCAKDNIYDKTYVEFVFRSDVYVKESLKIAAELLKYNPDIKITFKKGIKKAYAKPKKEE